MCAFLLFLILPKKIVSSGFVSIALCFGVASGFATSFVFKLSFYLCSSSPGVLDAVFESPTILGVLDALVTGMAYLFTSFCTVSKDWLIELAILLISSFTL